jgi:hypothetical protein
MVRAWTSTGGNWCDVFIDEVGAATKISGSATCDVTGADNKLVVYDGGALGGPLIRNRLAATKTIKYRISD